MAFRKILVAVDINDPENAKCALEAARVLCSSGSAEMSAEAKILYVRHYLPIEYSELISGDFDMEEKNRAESLIQQWKADFGLGNAKVVSSRGRVRDEVISHALDYGADVIVIGSDHPSLSSRILGSNASAIVSSSPISVLIARQKEAAE